MKKYLSTSTAVILVTLLLSGCFAKKSEPAPALPETLPVIEITTANTITYSEYPASVQGANDLEIRPQVDGSLEKVFVNEGAFVQAGQPLFKINDQPYREQLNSAAASLQAAQAAAINAQLEIDKLTPLVQNKVVAGIQLKMAQAAHKIALAQVQQASALVAAARINIGYTLIKAPVSGYIGRLLKKQGSLVSKADPAALTTLSDVHVVHVYFALGETDFTRFKNQYTGKNLEEKLRQLPPVSLVLPDNTMYPQTGRIELIDGQFDRNTGAITVRASFPNAAGLLRSGNTGKVRLALTHNGAFVVPQSSTVELQDKTFVYLLGDSNKVSRQAITIAAKSGTDYIVKEGIKVGDKIVFTGLDHLHDGAVITPQKTNLAALKK